MGCPARVPWLAVVFTALLLLLPVGAQSDPDPAALAAPSFGRSRGADVPSRLPEGLSALDWLAIVAVRDTAVHAVVATDTGHEARNPGQRWTTSFDGSGFTVVPDHGEWTWGLGLVSWGIAGAESRVAGPSAQVRVDGSRVEYAWSDALTEWFVNDGRGLEHGYTVHGPPCEATAGGPLVFRLAPRGPLRPRVADDGLGAAFVDATGATALHYDGLLVHDADGRTVEARMVDDGASLSLLVEVGTARYPLTIDPIAQQAYLKASNTGAADWFGFSVAVSGDTVVVGARGEASAATGVNGNQADNSAGQSGAAYVFVRSGASWSQQAYLKASNTNAGDSFGTSVAISGDTVVVGVPNEDSAATGVNGNQADNSAGSAGAAYVFVRSGTSWSQQAYLKASNTGAGDRFGSSVAVSGDTVVVGVPNEDSAATGVNGNQADNSAPLAGAAYVFVRGGTSWSQQAYLKASNTNEADLFGDSIAISGDTVVVGAFGEDSAATGVNGNQADDSATGAGAAYVFVRSGASWSQQAYLKASNTNELVEFSRSVAISGDTVVVSAYLEGSAATGVNGNQFDNSLADAGAAYVFVRSGSSWSQQAYLKASNTNATDYFGWSVAISGDTVVVGAFGESSAATGVNGNQSDNSATDAGAAYVFVRSGTRWSQQAYLKAANTNATDYFGWSAAISGDTVVVGSWREASSATGVNGNQSDNSTFAAGAAYVFDLDAAPQAALCLDVTAPIAKVWTAGTSPTPAEVLRKVINCGAAGTTLQWLVTESPSVGWLSVTPSSGSVSSASTGTQVSIQFHTAGLTPGLKSTTLIFKNSKNAANFISVPVSLDVLAQPAPDLALSDTTKVSAAFQFFGPPPTPIQRKVLNVGGAGTLLNWSTSISPPSAGNWLQLVQPAGSTSAGPAGTDVFFTFDATQLDAGTYAAAVTFQNQADPSDAQVVEVVLGVSEPPPGVGTNALVFGGLTLHASKIDFDPPSHYVLSGDVTIDDFIAVGGTANVDTAAKTLHTNGSLFLLTAAGTVPLLQGNIALAENSAQLTVLPGPGLQHKLSVGGLSIAIDKLTVVLAPAKGIGIGGTVTLPPAMGGIKASINNLSWSEATNAFQLQGQVTIPNVPIPPTGWSVTPLLLGFDTVAQNYSVSGTFKSGAPPFSVVAGGSIVAGQIQSLGATYSGPVIPIAANAGIDSLGASVSGLAAPPIVLQGSVGLVTQPSIPIPSNAINVLDVDAGLELTAAAAWAMKLNGGATALRPVTPIAGNVFGWAYSYDGLPLASAALVLQPGSFYGSADLNVLDVVIGNAWLMLLSDAQTGGIDLDGAVAGALQIPPGWPFGPIILASQQIDVDNDGLTASAYIGPVAVVLSLGIDGSIAFGETGGSTDAADGGGLEVPPGTSAVLIGARADGGELSSIDLIAPGGMSWSPATAPAFIPDLGSTRQTVMYLGSVGGDDALWYAVQNPAPGSWDVEAPAGTGAFEKLLVRGNARPRLDVSGPAQDVLGTNVSVSWDAHDSDDDAEIRFLLDGRGNAPVGVPVGPRLLESDGPGATTLDLTGIPAGEYRVVVVVDDGHGASVRAAAPGHVTVVPPGALPSPTGLNVTPEPDGRLRARWNPVAGSEGYRVEWRPEREEADPDFSVLSGSGSTEALLDVAPGRGWTVRVSAFSGAGEPGLPSEGVTARAGLSGVNDAPVPVGPVRLVAREGTPFAAPLYAEDAEGDPLTWQLASGPAGMSLDAASGLLTWLPSDQVTGLVPFEVLVTDGQGGEVVRAMELLVVPRFTPGQMPVHSGRPALTATPGVPYVADLRAFDPDGESVTHLLETSPNGMAVGAVSGLLTWLPTAADVGTHVVSVVAVDESGESSRLRFRIGVESGQTTGFSLGEALAIEVAPSGMYGATFAGAKGATARFITTDVVGLQPVLRILGPDGTVLHDGPAQPGVAGGAVTPFGRRAKTVVVPIVATGLHRLELRDATGSAGSCTIHTAAGPPPKTVQTLELVAGASGRFSFDGAPGMRIRRAVVKDGGAGTLAPDVSIVGPSGLPLDLGFHTEVAASGDLVSIEDVPLALLGQYQFRVVQTAGLPASAVVTIEYGW